MLSQKNKSAKLERQNTLKEGETKGVLKVGKHFNSWEKGFYEQNKYFIFVRLLQCLEKFER